MYIQDYVSASFTVKEYKFSFMTNNEIFHILTK